MPQTFQIVLFIFCITNIKSSIDNRRDELLSIIKRSLANSNINNEFHGHNYRRVLPKISLANSNSQYPKNITKQLHDKDPVLNFIKRRSSNKGDHAEMRLAHTSSESEEESSSLEMKKWKTEFREHWINKKFEAVNGTNIKGDDVNMVGARPWGTPCGDPNQHDMPWGTCVLPMECDAEYRVYRGDNFCGRTTFVCCAVQLTTYDLYEGFDVSFEDSGLRTDSDEKKRRIKTGSKEKGKKKNKNATKKRKRARLERKRKLKRNIRKIIKQIKKILNKQYRNGTNQRKKKTKQLKKFVSEMKKLYKNDRQSVKDIHDTEMIKIDQALLTRLRQIRDMNENFVKNATFRDIVVNGTVSKKGARMLMEAYPDLSPYVGIYSRRSNDGPDGLLKPTDYLEYDLEYGMLYY